MNGVNAPFGLKPYRYSNGAAYTGGGTRYTIASGYATALYSGDPVTLLSDGTIGIGVAGSAILGAFDHVEYQPASGQPQFGYWPAAQAVAAGTTAYAYVHDNPDLWFQIQESNGSGAAGTPLTLGNIANNANFYVGTGNATLQPEGQSYTTLDNTTASSGNPTYNLKILGLAAFPTGVNPVGAFAVWNVIINNHLLKGGTGTGGI